MVSGTEDFETKSKRLAHRVYRHCIDLNVVDEMNVPIDWPSNLYQQPPVR